MSDLLSVTKPKKERTPNGPLRYEDCFGIIDNELRKRQSKWLYHHIRWDDIAQSIRAKIALRWGHWDQSRPLAPYVNRIITNTLRNLARDSYLKLSKPCSKCAGNLGDGFCKYTKSNTQCSECPIFASWQRAGKESNFNAALPVSIESHVDVVRNVQGDFYDVEQGVQRLTKLLKGVLTPVEYKVYIWLFIEKRDELYLA
jgi:hypothetical protein